MSYNTWSNNYPEELQRPPILTRRVLVQIYHLLRIGYFRWLVMSLPAYIIPAVVSFLLIKAGHVRIVTVVLYNNNVVSHGDKVAGLGYLLAALGVILIGVFWGEAFSVRSVAASYFTGKSNKSFRIDLSFAQIIKTLLASIIILIALAAGTVLFVFPAIIWFCSVYLVVAIISLENQRSINEAFSISNFLVKGYKWRIVTVQFWINLIQVVIFYSISALFGITAYSGPYFAILTIIYFFWIPIYTCSALIFYCELRLQGSHLSPEDLAKSIGISLTDTPSHNAVFINGQVQSDDSNAPVYGGRYPSNEDAYRGSYGGGGLDDSGNGDLSDFAKQNEMHSESQSMPEYNPLIPKYAIPPDPASRVELWSQEFVSDLPMRHEANSPESTIHSGESEGNNLNYPDFPDTNTEENNDQN